MLKDSGEKVQAADKTEVESALADAKKTLEGSPSTSEMKSAHEKLTHASHKLAEALYKASSSQTGPASDASAGAPPPASRRKTKESSTPNTSTSTTRSKAAPHGNGCPVLALLGQEGNWVPPVPRIWGPGIGQTEVGVGDIMSSTPPSYDGR